MVDGLRTSCAQANDPKAGQTKDHLFEGPRAVPGNPKNLNSFCMGI